MFGVWDYYVGGDHVASDANDMPDLLFGMLIIASRPALIRLETRKLCLGLVRIP
jgi:hypothetical protein